MAGSIHLTGDVELTISIWKSCSETKWEPDDQGWMANYLELAK